MTLGQLNPYLKPYIKLNFRHIKDPNMKNKTPNFLADNIGGYLYDWG